MEQPPPQILYSRGTERYQIPSFSDSFHCVPGPFRNGVLEEEGVLLKPKELFSDLKEISPEHSLEGLMLKLKHQYFGHLMRRTDSLGKTLMLGD